ncbi:MAG TPA: phage/plasmid primase, P4 family, partial [Acidovorax defluvii]|nr:phage/plasmid primase, P4 family [Acidovorax defluvii]
FRRLGVAMPSEKALVAEPISTYEEKNSDRVLVIADALNAIKDVSDRDKWLKIGMALHHELPNSTGFNLWKEWSVKWPKYCSDDQESTWKGFGPSSNPRTIRTLFQLAIADGWVASEDCDLPHTVLALNDAFCQRVKNQLCFVPEENKWRRFKSPVWVADFPEVVDHARKVIEEMTQEARQAKDAVAQKLLGGYLKIPKIRALLADASVSPGLNMALNSFDTNPDLLALQNGVVDLKTGEFRPGRPDDKLTMQAPTVYDANATCPQFQKLLKFVTRGNSEYTSYLQHALGYTICGHTNKQAFFIVYGPGGNLKGTLFRAVGKVLGPLSIPISPNLMARAYAGNPNSPSPAIMALARARMFQCTEGEDGKRFDTAFVKQLTGNDELSGRAIQGDQARFAPVGKPWLATNSLPYVSSQDEAMWRRIQLLPFKRVMKKRDGSVEDSLALEAPGILNWLVKGAVLANSQRDLPKCEVVEKATERARLNCDSVKYWLTENCVMRESARLQSSRAFSAYRKFCRQQHLPPLSQPQFSRAMTSNGVFTKRASAHNEFRGIELREPGQDLY